MYEVQKHKQNYIVTADRSFNRKYQLVATIQAKVTGLGVRNRVPAGSSNTAVGFKEKFHSLIANAIGKMSAHYMVDSKEVSIDPVSEKELKYKTIVSAKEYIDFRRANKKWIWLAMFAGRGRYRRRAITVFKYKINKKSILRAKDDKTGRFTRTPTKKWLKSKKIEID